MGSPRVNPHVTPLLRVFHRNFAAKFHPRETVGKFGGFPRKHRFFTPPKKGGFLRGGYPPTPHPSRVRAVSIPPPPPPPDPPLPTPPGLAGGRREGGVGGVRGVAVPRAGPARSGPGRAGLPEGGTIAGCPVGPAWREKEKKKLMSFQIGMRRKVPERRAGWRSGGRLPAGPQKDSCAWRHSPWDR